MGMLSRFFHRGKKRKLASTAATDKRKQGGNIAPELAKALQDMLDNDYHGAIAQAQNFCQNPDSGIMSDAHRICAISHSRIGSYEKGFEHYLCLFELEGGVSAHTALQLATTSVMCGEESRGAAWFIKFDQLNLENPEVSSGEARANFIAALASRGEWLEAFNHLNWLKEGYKSLHITDSHFLYMRGFPFFEIFLDKSYAIVSQVLKGEALFLWYEELGEWLDKDGQDAVIICIKKIKERVDIR
ncbi:hypothetical protein ACQ7NX_20535 [Enterobacter cloacae subsp. dissolvens]